MTAHIRRRSPTEADLSLLGPLAEHRLLTVSQVAVLLDCGDRGAGARLRALERRGWLRARKIFAEHPTAAMITREGLRAAGSTLGEPSLNLNEYGHEVGVGWLWLAARAGALGELTAMATERTMRSADARLRADGVPPQWGAGTGMIGRYGDAEYHYPDLMLELASGHRVAVELELTGKGSERLARIMRAYASDASVDEVLYVVDGKRVADAVRTAAATAGIPGRVHTELMAPDGIEGAPGPEHRSRRTHTRPAARGQLRPHATAHERAEPSR